MKVTDIPIAELKPHPANPRTHPEDEIRHLQASLKAYGWYKNVVRSQDGFTLCGHGMLVAAERNGETTAPCETVPLAHDHPKALKLMALDNTVSRLAEDDDTQLAALLADIQRREGLEGTGYNDAELDALIAEVAAANNPTPPDEFPSYDENVPTEYECPKCGYSWSGKPGGGHD